MRMSFRRFFVALLIGLPAAQVASAARPRLRTLADLALWEDKYAHALIGGIEALEIPELKRKMRAVMGSQGYSRFQRFLKRSLVDQVQWYGSWMSFGYCEAHNCGHNFVIFVRPEDASVIVCETLMPSYHGGNVKEIQFPVSIVHSRWLGLKARVSLPNQRCEVDGFDDYGDAETWDEVVDQRMPKEVR